MTHECLFRGPELCGPCILIFLPSVRLSYFRNSPSIESSIGTDDEYRTLHLLVVADHEHNPAKEGEVVDHRGWEHVPVGQASGQS